MSQPLLIILIILAYVGILLAISHYSSRHADNSTFFIGNRRMPWLAVALAMITAPISGVTFISVPGMVVTKGYGYLQMCMGFIVGYFVIALILVPLYYRHNIVSIYGFLEQRFGREAYKTGASFFLLSKVLGTGVRFLVVCLSLQVLVFSPLGIPFVANVVMTMALIGIYTVRGGVKTVVRADMFKSICLVVSTLLCIYFISSRLGFSIGDLAERVSQHPSSRVMFMEDSMDGNYFWKQFIAGIFLVVAMTGLDQDMMQHTLSCRDTFSSRKNLYLSSFLQFGVITLFLMLGTLMMIYMETFAMDMPEKSDDIFASVAFHKEMPVIVGILFVLGLVSSSYSSVGSALTSLTTSFTVDILEGQKRFGDKKLSVLRKIVHISIATLLIIIILGFYYLNDRDAISAVYTMASYTYGPILGLFIFGIFNKRQVNGRFVAAICIMAPVLSWVVQFLCDKYFGYTIGYELLLLNAGLILLGLYSLPATKTENLSVEAS